MLDGRVAMDISCSNRYIMDMDTSCVTRIYKDRYFILLTCQSSSQIYRSFSTDRRNEPCRSSVVVLTMSFVTFKVNVHFFVLFSIQFSDYGMALKKPLIKETAKVSMLGFVEVETLLKF